MQYKKSDIYFYIHKDTNQLYKIIIYPQEGAIRIYNQREELVMSRTGLNKKQIQDLEKKLQCMIKI